MDFFTYLLPYYDTKIQHLERISQAGHLPLQSPQHLFAASLLKFVDDMRDEGYVETYARFHSDVQAQSRLKRLLNIPDDVCSQAWIQRHYGLYSHTAASEVSRPCQYVGRIPLSDYLTSLLKLGEHDLSWEVLDAPRYQPWREKTQVLLRELVDYLFWILTGPSQNYACLLRDTLLLYLGLWLLREADVPIGDIRALCVSRAYFALCGQPNFYYRAVSDQIYAALWQCPSASYADFHATYQMTVSSVLGEADNAAMVQTLTRYLDDTLLDQPYVLLESGLQGSIPMFLDYLSDNIAEFRMYTTAPWLTQIYAPLIFSTNYIHLRDIETVLAHDVLFALTDKDSQTLYVAETNNALLKTLAYYEIVTFKEMVVQRLHHTAPNALWN